MDCNCKGKNVCVLCRQDLFFEEVTRKSKQFSYCSVCKNKAFISKDHQSHLDVRSLIEFKDFIKIDGVLVCENAIDCEQERQLVERMDQDDWISSQSGRRKQDFGPKINFKKRKLKLGDFNGLPLLYVQVLDQLKDRNQAIKAKLNDFKIVELCCLEYKKERGSSIGAHFDDPYFWGGRILTLNLLSSTKLILTKKQPNETGRSEFESILNEIEIIIQLNGRSLIVLDNEARYEWLHEVRREDIEKRRIAITYRELANEFLPNNSLFSDQINQLLTLAANRI